MTSYFNLTHATPFVAEEVKYKGKRFIRLDFKTAASRVVFGRTLEENTLVLSALVTKKQWQQIDLKLDEPMPAFNLTGHIGLDLPLTLVSGDYGIIVTKIIRVT